MSQAGETFFTSVGCMDGRVQKPIADFGKERFGAEYPDTITEAGLVGLLAKDDVDQNLVESIKTKVEISLQKHHSKGIIVHGHQDCAGNPVHDEKHKQDILKASKIISNFVPADVAIIPVFVSSKDHQWVVEELH